MGFWPGSDRRQHPRFDFDTPVQVVILNGKADGNAIQTEARITDVSLRGVRVVIDSLAKKEFKSLLLRQSVRRIRIDGMVEVRGELAPIWGTLVFLDYRELDRSHKCIFGVTLDAMDPALGKQWLGIVQSAVSKSSAAA